ncbi:unnamed protein product [Amaranthus hypochondriacus]
MKRDRDREVSNDDNGNDKGKSSSSNYGIPSTNTHDSYNYPNQPKRNFMQKHYHPGAFFQSDPDDLTGTAGFDEIYRRDFSAPTGEDKMNKTILPKSMQVKNFGRRGRTKWTHLSNEDTTDFNSPWSYSKPLSQKYNARMAGMDKPIARPKGNKKLKDWDI